MMFGRDNHKVWQGKVIGLTVSRNWAANDGIFNYQ